MILAIDFETTGLDTETCDVIEVGAVLWDEREKTPLIIMSDFVSCRTVPPEITEITGIKQSHLAHGKDFRFISEELSRLALQAEYLVAHNGTNFDRPIYNRLLGEKHPGGGTIHWIDTSVDIPYPKNIITRKLSYLAAEHGFCNPFSHRALFDCLTMLKILSHYDFREVAEISKLPSRTLIAQVSYDDRQLAKDRGYRWDSDRRLWVKTMKIGIDKEIAEAGFGVKVME